MPATSGYTFAIELSADEALASGASSVTFDHPIVTYVDNFLHVGVGETVPTGRYDSTAGAWIPERSGRVIRVLGVTAGLADVDVDGDGTADTAALAALGITDEERAELASLFSPGVSVWRFSASHFSAWDCNWPYGLPDDAVPPGGAPPGTPPGGSPPGDPGAPPGGSPPAEPPGAPPGGPPASDPDCHGGSIIECENQTLIESLPLEGTPFHLTYRSDRARGFTDVVEIPLTGSSVPASLLAIDLTIDVAGRHFVESLTPAPNLKYTFRWDRRDSYGRLTQGRQPISARVGFRYPAVYGRTPDFGSYGDGTDISSDAARLQATLARSVLFFVGGWDASVVGLGGWTLSGFEAYDSQTNTFYDSESPSTAGMGVVTSITGAGRFSADFDGHIALTTGIDNVSGMTMNPAGEILYAAIETSLVMRIGRDGRLHTVAGQVWDGGNGGDEGPALAAQLRFPRDVAVGPDGSIYIADTGNHRVRQITPDGIIHAFAGDGTEGFSGDGGLAVAGHLSAPESVTVAADGSVYISDTGNRRIRRVMKDGVIRTIAGTGVATYGRDAVAAQGEPIYAAGPIRAVPDGSVLFVEFRRVRRVTGDGLIHTVAGSPDIYPGGSTGDGGPALSAHFWTIAGLGVARDGS
ncbi:MAG: hypothetical protein WCJ30_20345, partial [Deltaproteobacteria bacterium]